MYVAALSGGRCLPRRGHEALSSISQRPPNHALRHGFPATAAAARGSLKVFAAAKGARTPDSSTSGDTITESVEMFVAHDEDMGIFGRAKQMARRIVPRPRSGNTSPNTVPDTEDIAPPNASAPAAETTTPAPAPAPTPVPLLPATTASDSTGLEKVDGQATAMATMAQKRARALQAELGIVSSELREKSMEVKQSEKVIRQKDSEIAGLKGMLQQKEMQVVAARSELVDARVQLQEKDGALQSALEQLTSAARERSQLRKDLIGAQTELMETRGEIERWTIHLNQLKAVMDSVDVDEMEGSAMEEMAVEGIADLDADQMIDDQYFDMLMDLNDLASTLAKEAAQDEDTFRRLDQHMGGQQDV